MYPFSTYLTKEFVSIELYNYYICYVIIVTYFYWSHKVVTIIMDPAEEMK